MAEEGVTTSKPFLDELTDEEIDKAIRWINAHATSPNDACPVCGSPHNAVLSGLARLDFRNVERPGTMPLVVALCYNCGFVRLFNAIVLELRASDDPDAIASVLAEMKEQDREAGNAPAAD